MIIKRIKETDSRTDRFIQEEFSAYAVQEHVVLNYQEFCFVAENDNGELLGVITGRAYYNEVHIGDLIIGKDHRKCGLGSKLVAAVEEAFQNAGYDKITLTTFGFQAPAFYQKLGYAVEFVRENPDPKLRKYFLAKQLSAESGQKAGSDTDSSHTEQTKQNRQS